MTANAALPEPGGAQQLLAARHGELAGASLRCIREYVGLCGRLPGLPPQAGALEAMVLLAMEGAALRGCHVSVVACLSVWLSFM